MPEELSTCSESQTEIAGKAGGEKISKEHVDEAVGRLQKDRISTTLSSASYQLKLSSRSTCKNIIFNG